MAHYCDRCGSVTEDNHKTLVFGDFRLNRATLELRAKSAVHVSPIQANVLADLTNGRVISREAMMMRHFPECVSDNLPGMYVMQLRRRLVEVGSSCRIRTVFGIGYKMEAG